MNDLLVVIVFGVAMLLTVAWIVTAGVQRVRHLRALEQERQNEAPDPRQATGCESGEKE